MALNKQRSYVIYGLWGFVGLVAILIGSPYLLAAISMLPLDWDKLNAVGQSYTGISALLAGAALIGVVITTRLQARQVTVAQEQALREMHFALNQMSLADYDLASGLTREDLTSEDLYPTWRQRTYCSMWLRYLQFGYSLDALTDEFVRGVLAEENFAHEVGRSLWNDVGETVAYPNKSDRTARFRRIVTDEYQKAVAKARKNSEISDDASPPCV